MSDFHLFTEEVHELVPYRDLDSALGRYGHTKGHAFGIKSRRWYVNLGMGWFLYAYEDLPPEIKAQALLLGI